MFKVYNLHMYIITLKTSENEYSKHEVLSSSVVDPYHFDLDPDRGKADPDPTLDPDPQHC